MIILEIIGGLVLASLMYLGVTSYINFIENKSKGKRK